MNLNALSNSTTRTLDNTYYSVLEKHSMLQNTITSLKELANLTRELNEEFKIESGGIVSDVIIQLDGFDGFEEKEKRIVGLAERVKAGREKISVLGGRVDVVRDRVDGWERAEGEWQERTRRRLKILWIMMAVCVAAVVALVGFRFTPAKTTGAEVPTGSNATGLLGKIPPDLENLQNDRWALNNDIGKRLEGLGNKDERLDDDPRLKIFDEL